MIVSELYYTDMSIIITSVNLVLFIYYYNIYLYFYLL